MKSRSKTIKTIAILTLTISTLITSGCEGGREHQKYLERIKLAAAETQLRLQLEAEEVRHAMALQMQKARDVAIAAEQEAARITIAAAAAVERTKRHGITMDTVRHTAPFGALAVVLMSVVVGLVSWRRAYFRAQEGVIRELKEFADKHFDKFSPQERMVLISAMSQGSASMSGLTYKPS